ncbi:MAG: hypothetical protein AB7P17_15545 [Nitrospirales bacterium]
MTNENQPEPDHEEKGLQNLLIRLTRQSRQNDFQGQRQTALALALKPYLAPLTTQYLSPLEEEIQLAERYLVADYFPTDGHPSLVEQIRDTITDHIPEEKRLWLDPVRHSYMDVLTILSVDSSIHPNRLELQSLGNRRRFQVNHMVSPALRKNRVLLTRLIRGPAAAYLPGPPLILSKAVGDVLLTSTHNLRRNIEFDTGNFALAEWPEFAKQYGYLFIWSLAGIRGGAMVVADAEVTYRTEKGDPFLYALAMYEHSEFRRFTTGLDEWKQLLSCPHNQSIDSKSRLPSDIREWIEQTPKSDRSVYAVARVTLPPTQLTVEADSASRLDDLKHQLASTFGFSLHFKGETLTPPSHSPPHVDLLAEEYIAPPVTVRTAEEARLLSSFSEKVYLEWAEQPCPTLNNETPRHYARVGRQQKDVAALIDQMAKHDLGLRRMGKPAYDYNILRSHIGM